METQFMNLKRKDVRFSKLDKWIEISKDANEETCRKYQALT